MCFFQKSDSVLVHYHYLSLSITGIAVELVASAKVGSFLCVSNTFPQFTGDAISTQEASRQRFCEKAALQES
jgi:hypothetical protein